MSKPIQYIIWAMALIALNMAAFPVALVSLFASRDFFSLDGLIALLIILMPNLISLQ
ncbi:hypothetical protein [Bacillus sp. 1P06AnD]|uniref:hypothetical protein n=1 Tax=Bacillus sp. 1P06AnD TaxID=3132208 RepID=UPI00399F5517